MALRVPVSRVNREPETQPACVAALPRRLRLAQGVGRRVHQLGQRQAVVEFERAVFDAVLVESENRANQAIISTDPGEFLQLPARRYEVLQLLGSGGMASVYEAEHTVLGSKHALKVLRTELVANAGITLHVANLYGANNHHIAESCFKALARALRAAVAIDPRRAHEVPSTKGSLGG